MQAPCDLLAQSSRLACHLREPGQVQRPGDCAPGPALISTAKPPLY